MDELISIFDMDGGDVQMPFTPEWVGRLPSTIYAVKYREECQDGKWRTYIFLLGSKEAYDERMNGREKGQGMKGTVTWEPITKTVKRPKKQIEGQGGLF